jgi:hypothetical protein
MRVERRVRVIQWWQAEVVEGRSCAELQLSLHVATACKTAERLYGLPQSRRTTERDYTYVYARPLVTAS